MQKIKSNNELLALNKAGRALSIRKTKSIYTITDVLLIGAVIALLSAVVYMSGIDLMNYNTVTFINH